MMTLSKVSKVYHKFRGKSIRFFIRTIYLTAKDAKKFFNRIVKLIDNTLLERNDGVIRNRDMLWTYLGTTFRDIAIPNAV